MKFNRKNLSDFQLLEFYKNLITSRLFEELMINQIRLGKISKWFSGIGQEAISVGSTMALNEDDYILTMHRNLGVFISRKVPLEKLFDQIQGKHSGFTKGRDRSFHFGTKEHHIVGMISHLGTQNGVADGIALYDLLHNNKKVTLVFTGEGATSEGEFHEAVNLAAVWNLPVIFLIENNGYGLSTPVHEQFKCKRLSDKGIGYGIKALTIDGNNVLEVYHTVKEFSELMRKEPQPVLIEAISFRMHGHEEASGTKYIPKHLILDWSKKDPIDNFEKFLIEEKILNEEKIKQIRKEINHTLNENWTKSLSNPHKLNSVEEELRDVYAPFYFIETKPKSEIKSDKRFVDAISDALRLAMRKYPDLIIMGQDIAEYGGVFKVTQGFVDEFGKQRVRNTPISEAATVGASLGYSIAGGKSVVEMQFADFISAGFTQVINNLAKIHYRWGQNADVVIRMPTGAGVSAGPFHSQSNEAWFFHTPGLKIVYPSNSYDAKGLLLSSIEDPNPVMFFEHKALYRSVGEIIPDDYYTIPIGKGKIVSEGDDICIITYGMGVHWALKSIKQFPDFSFQIVDLRSLLPWDKELVTDSVIKTNKVL
ncbi:MAG: thiamine pyrophosphate-dependent enzyme, partial [Ignavibacterium sp.]|nr:thiamine pyrophosphate-dependent enzyme [Ignavibacterium sp.]MDW8375909.1 thiamine pyrophosphate-dependent enzyme [Ignavibacteriales bacterium]